METPRITSFSTKPGDKKGCAEVEKLKKYSELTGISFSNLVIRAITNLNKELSK